MKNTIFEELSKKLGESSINNIREFLEKNLDIQLDFFIQCFQLVEKSKLYHSKQRENGYLQFS